MTEPHKPIYTPHPSVGQHSSGRDWNDGPYGLDCPAKETRGPLNTIGLVDLPQIWSFVCLPHEIFLNWKTGVNAMGKTVQEQRNFPISIQLLFPTSFPFQKYSQSQGWNLPFLKGKWSPITNKDPAQKWMVCCTRCLSTSAPILVHTHLQATEMWELLKFSGSCASKVEGSTEAKAGHRFAHRAGSFLLEWPPHSNF